MIKVFLWLIYRGVSLIKHNITKHLHPVAELGATPWGGKWAKTPDLERCALIRGGK